jgi:UTP--glucose-1-phosphate uridylyltransferase
MAVKGVIVAAGYGSRFLPVTRVVPKELLPIVDRPAIDFVVQEFAEAGIEEVLVITSRRKKALDDWFDRDVELESLFARERMGLPPVRASFVRQMEMKGTGHALMMARTFAGNDPVVVAFPDDLFGQPNCTALLMAAHATTGCSVLSVGDLTGHDVSRYGVVDAVGQGPIVRVRGIVEKPPRGKEPSHLVSWGRYLYTPEVFEALAEGMTKHVQGEYYATDAISLLASRDRVVAAVVPSPRFDTGDKLGYLTTVIHFALEHPELGAPLRDWLAQKLRP